MKIAGNTYRHLKTILITEFRDMPPGSDIRILDAGCGNGSFVVYLRETLQERMPLVNWLVQGFDVRDHAVIIGSEVPGITCIGVADSWPYPDNHFDAVVSNQVFEHVASAEHFLAELSRVLKDGGISAQVFPTKHNVHEFHLNIPFAHWIKDRDIRVAWIKTISRLGFGAYSLHKYLGTDLETFSQQHADFIDFWCDYRTTEELLDLGRRQRLRASFRYTPELYGQYLRTFLRRPELERYTGKRSVLMDMAALKFLRYIGDVTLFLQKTNQYSQGLGEKATIARRNSVDP